MQRNLHRALQDADDGKVALGHFNVSEMVVLKAAGAAAHDLDVPVIIGVSESERRFLGVREIRALVSTLRDDLGISMYLNADHTHSLEKTEEAAKAGFDSVVFDASKLPFEANVAQTKRAVEAAKSINPSIVVEGEIGYIGSGSEIHRVAEARGPLTTPEEAKQFAAETRIDVLAPAVGSAHGMQPAMITGETHQHLDVARIAAIKAATGLPLTLHGGSGTADGDFRAAIGAGITVIHVSTELRLAWRHGLEIELAAHPEEVAPYDLFTEASARVGDVIRAKLSLFSSRLPLNE
jgi:fructose-bisphosphate aldolase class II